jgi:acetate kinase
MIIFTGGVGENSYYTRAEVVKGLEFLGLDFDFEQNIGVHGEEKILTRSGSKVKVLVVPTNEELIIAHDTMGILDNMRSQGSYTIIDY